jgi:mono/diheme cytochrome c family protein
MIIKGSITGLFIIATTCLTLARQDNLKESMTRGEAVYGATCASCHQPAGEGLEAVFPPLAKTDYLKNQKRAIGIVIHGQEGEITVNGKQYSTPMAALDQLSDQEVADVLNFVSNSWGNKNPMIKAEQVKAQRK